MIHFAKSALVVDDDPEMLAAVRETLQTFLQWDVTTSSDPEYAFELGLRSTFDLFIFDLVMPKLNGDVLYRLLTKSYLHSPSEPRRIPPLLIITGHGSDPAAREMLSLPGVRGLLPKPFSIERLLDKVESVFAPEILGSAIRAAAAFPAASRSS